MLNEDLIEMAYIDQLVGQGFEFHHGPDIAPDSDNPQRNNFDSVVLENELLKAIEKLNPGVPSSAINEAHQKVLNLGTEDIMENNERFHTYLTSGVPVEFTKDGISKGINVNLLDINNPENNSFWVVNQLVIIENNLNRRLDVVIYINGLPLVVVELKNAASEKATIRNAYTQMQNYKNGVPSIFFYNALCVISDGIDAKVSSLSAPFTRFLSWKAPEETGLQTELQVMTKHMFDKRVLINLIRYCTVFEAEEKKDGQTGLVSISKVKKVAAYHQYYAVQKAVEQTLRATDAEAGDRKVGVVWHTQGSGKSLSMVFFSGQIITHPKMKNPTVVILTDRNDLDDQLFGTFGNCVGLLRQTPVQAKSRDHIKELLKVSGGGVIFSTIQKFSPDEGNVYDTLSERTNIVVVADEAHRSQYGFKGRLVEIEDGSEIRYGNAKYMRDALPNASYIGFTGTPIEKEDKSTPAVFGDYIDVYDIKQAVEDGATVPINYEARLVKVNLDNESSEDIDSLVEEISDTNEDQLEKSKKKNATINAIVGHPDRLKDVATDLITHFEARQEVFEGKAMIVGMTRQICVALYNQIISLRPNWHNDDVNSGQIKVIMTSSSEDPQEFQPHRTTKKQRKDLAIRMKDPKDPLNIVIVRDMWLTGFDVPNMHTMYVDKKMKGANLMQAIARVNRVYKDKPGGLIVDYIGIGQELRNAMGTYLQSGGQGKAIIDKSEAVALMKEKFEIVEQIFHGYDYKAYFKSKTNTKLQILLGAQNFILSNMELKDRFIKEITILSKVFALSIPNVEANIIKDQVAFFQAVKARIAKFTPSGFKSDYEIDTAIKQIIDSALSSDGIIDVFEAAGLKTPDLGILSEEFLLEVKNMEQKNIAYELLKKLLKDDVRIRKTKNISQAKKFSEMIESVVNKYHNNQIDSAQVLEELSKIAREMRLDDNKAEELGLSEEEYAFYTVLNENESTKILDDNKMKELIHHIVEIIRKNATVDWSRRSDVRAKLRITVRKILMKYGYPPDLARMEADKVIEQSEVLAEKITKN